MNGAKLAAYTIITVAVLGAVVFLGWYHQWITMVVVALIGVPAIAGVAGRRDSDGPPDVGEGL